MSFTIKDIHGLHNIHLIFIHFAGKSCCFRACFYVKRKQLTFQHWKAVQFEVLRMHGLEIRAPLKWQSSLKRLVPDIDLGQVPMSLQAY